MAALIRLRRGTTAQWAATSSILKLGEPGYDTDLKVLKIGDGVSGWTSLNPIAGQTNEQVQDLVSTMLLGGTHNGIEFEYNDASGEINATVTGGGGGGVYVGPTEPTDHEAFPIWVRTT